MTLGNTYFSVFLGALITPHLVVPLHVNPFKQNSAQINTVGRMV